MCIPVIFKELLCNKLYTPKERVPLLNVSDSNFEICGIVHVIFNELLCNKLGTPTESYFI